MKINHFLAVLFVVYFLAFFNCQTNSQTLSAKDIVKRADEKGRGQTSQGTMTLTIIRPTWTRSITMKSWTKGTDYSLIYISSPAKEKGQVFLKRHDDMWNWMPSIERLIKIPPSMMMQSWMGSDYTNDDLVKESSIVVDYTQKILGNEMIRDQECYKIELIPLEDAPVTWGKIITWISVKGFDQLKTEFYDEDMNLINRMNAYDIKKMGDREIPTRLEIEPVNKKGNKTILELSRMEFNKPISESFFSQQNMKSIN